MLGVQTHDLRCHDWQRNEDGCSGSGSVARLLARARGWPRIGADLGVNRGGRPPLGVPARARISTHRTTTPEGLPSPRSTGLYFLLVLLGILPGGQDPQEPWKDCPPARGLHPSSDQGEESWVKSWCWPHPPARQGVSRPSADIAAQPPAPARQGVPIMGADGGADAPPRGAA